MVSQGHPLKPGCRIQDAVLGDLGSPPTARWGAACESFMKTLKYEEIYRQEYRDMAEALASIGEFIDRIYNQKRLHSALG